MSRLLVALSVALACARPSLAAQSLTDEQIAAQIENARRMVAVDVDGCVKYPVSDEIVVCGKNEDNERQKLSPEVYDADRIRRGEPVSSERAAGCVFGNGFKKSAHGTVLRRKQECWKSRTVLVLQRSCLH